MRKMAKFLSATVATVMTFSMISSAALPAYALKSERNTSELIYMEQSCEPYDYGIADELYKRYNKAGSAVGSDSSSDGITYDKLSGYGGQLTAAQKKVYDALKSYFLTESELLSGNTSGFVYKPEGNSVIFYDSNEIFHDLFYAYYAFIHDYPQMFWAGGVSASISMGYAPNGGYVLESADFTILEAYPDATQHVDEYNQNVAKIAAQIYNSSEKKDTYSLYKAVHDWMCRNMSYYNGGDMSGNMQIYSSGAVFAGDGVVVCEGYGETFKVLCDYLRNNYSVDDMYTALVVGWANTGGGHMWNYALMDEKWYAVDVTWDDQSTIYYTYFLCGAESQGFDYTFIREHTERNYFSSDSSLTVVYPELERKAYVVDEEDTPESTEPVMPDEAYWGEWNIDENGCLTISGDGVLGDWRGGSAPWRSHTDSITEVVVKNGVTAISPYAFDGMSKVKSIRIADTVDYIYENSFRSCTSLEQLTVPFIGKTINAKEDSGVLGYFFGKGSSAGVAQFCIVEENRLKGYYFDIPSSLKCVRITKDTDIAMGAFCNCTSLEKLYINSSVKYIDLYAFNNCSSLSEVVFFGEQSDYDAIDIYMSENWDFIAAKVTFFPANQEECNFGNHSFNAEIICDEALLHQATALEDAVYFKSCEHCGMVDTDESNVFIAEGTALAVRGDCDGDGKITVSDVTLILRYLASLVEFDETQIALADVDMNGNVDIMDATYTQYIISVESFVIV